MRFSLCAATLAASLVTGVVARTSHADDADAGTDAGTQMPGEPANDAGGYAAVDATSPSTTQPSSTGHTSSTPWYPPPPFVVEEPQPEYVEDTTATVFADGCAAAVAESDSTTIDDSTADGCNTPDDTSSGDDSSDDDSSDDDSDTAGASDVSSSSDSCSNPPSDIRQTTRRRNTSFQYGALALASALQLRPRKRRPHR